MPVDRMCKWCGKHFRVKPSMVTNGRAECCSQSCSAKRQWAGQPRGSGYRDIRAVGHPLANKNGTVREHRVILYDRIGPGTHPCHWCTTSVKWTPGGRTSKGSLLVDHLDGDKRNNAPDNLVPSCHRCNIWRNPPQPLVQDDELFITKPDGSRCRAKKHTCEWCGAEFLRQATINTGPQPRFCSRPCAARGRGKPRAVSSA